MITINEHFLKLKSSYLFANISNRINDFTSRNPDADIIKLGIGDVTKPLPGACVKAFNAGVDDMADEKSFKGYGPDYGYEFLTKAIAENDYNKRGVSISPDEIFISDGAKCDTGNIQEIFSSDAMVAVPDPVYPVYVDTNVMAGRTGKNVNGRYENLIYLESTEKNNFVPELPAVVPDLIYLCFPNNPTGSTASKAELKKWVDYARDNKALILFDAAYEAFITDAEIPHSIFEIDGAGEVAVEFRSFSKTAGFTGTRCAYTVISKKCQAFDSTGKKHSLHELWSRRQATKFNGVSYPVQKAAAAVYTPEGTKQVQDNIDFYLENAAIIRKAMEESGFSCTGGINSPYIWVNMKTDSWKAFDTLLQKASVVITPGEGFGKCGKGYIRISAFNDRQKVIEAMDRIKNAL